MPNPFDAVSCFFRNPVSGFFVCFANPRTAFGFKRRGVFNPHLSGVIRSAAPIGAGLALIRGLYSEFADLVWLYIGASNRPRRTLEPTLQVTETTKIPAGMTDIITLGEATISHAAHGRWSETRGFAKPIPKPRGGHVGTIRKFNRGVTGKDSG